MTVQSILIKQEHQYIFGLFLGNLIITYFRFFKFILIQIYSKAKIAKQNELNNAKSKLQEYEKKLNKNLEIIKMEKVGKEVTNERQILLDKLKNLETQKLQLENELKKHENSNPIEYEQMKKNIIVCNPNV